MRIVIAEDSAVIRAGLVEILADRGHETVAAVGDAEALRAAVDQHEPDAAIVDVRMPPDYTDEGIRAAIAIRRDHPGTGVLVFSQYIETRHAAELLGAASSRGAAGIGYRPSTPALTSSARVPRRCVRVMRPGPRRCGAARWSRRRGRTRCASRR